jgi:uncharacterized protein YndB with AHSA1/START domain
MSDAATSATAPEPGITITRVFDAPRELVFRMWTEPEHFADWFGADAEVPVSSVSMDVRPGGEWRATMLAGPDGTIPWRGVYQEVVEPERLVLTITDRPGGEYELLTVVLTDLGDNRTEMRFQQAGGHMNAEEYGRAEQGWGAFFDRMTQRLAAA